MSIVASEAKFKVTLDVEGAKADMQRLEREVAKGNSAARGAGPSASGAGGKGGGVASSAKNMLGQAASRIEGIGGVAAAVGLAIAAEQTAERFAADVYAALAGLAKGTALEGFFDLAQKEAQRSGMGQWLTRARIGAVTLKGAASGTIGILEDVAKLGGKTVGANDIATAFSEQWKLARQAAEMENLKTKITEQITARATGQLAAEGIDALRKRLNLW
jgi:hypothetical protein